MQACSASTARSSSLAGGSVGAGPSDVCIEWDAENRLTRVLNNGTEVVRYKYDGQGRRAERIAAGVTTSFVNDGVEVLEERTDGNTTRYVHGPGIDQHWGRRDPDGAVSFYVADHLGSIVQTTNLSATVTLTRQYDPWGNQQLPGSATSGYAFNGREWDASTALAYYRGRYYAPSLGRFLNEDPIGITGGINFYSYVGGNPLRYVDPLGWAPRDQRHGLPDEFWRWYHRQYKTPGDPNIDGPDARRLYDEWKKMGEPDDEGSRTKPVPEPAPDPNSKEPVKDPGNPDDKDKKRTACESGGCSPRLVPVVVTVGVATYIVWQIVKTCSCTAAGGPALGGACLVAPF